jgi:hypothetical protein
LNADAAVNIGAGRLERELRHVPVRHEQQCQQYAANKDKIPTEGHARHRCVDPQKPAVNGNNPQWFQRKCHGQQYEGLRPRGINRVKAATWLMADVLENRMADPDIVESACARVWSVYLMINRDLNQNDARRALLKRFLRNRWEAGDSDAEFLAVEGLKYLKSLEGSSTD